jgi:hypothetical protein
MSTKKGFRRWALAGAAVLVLSGPASANLINDPPSVTTNTSAAIVVYPKIVVDPANGIDTHIQLTNVADFLTRAHCFYVNANGHCSNDPAAICTQETVADDCDPGGRCVEGWVETDFRLTLTKRQPLSWSASDGRTTMPLPPRAGEEDFAQSNKDSNIPPVPEVPFIGELRCIQVDVSSQEPIALNHLAGLATIVRDDVCVPSAPGSATGTCSMSGGSCSTTADTCPDIDASKYAAIGIPAIEGRQDDDPNTLNIGGPNAEYNGCPNVLTYNNYFDNAAVPTAMGTLTVESRLTFVPCAADFREQIPGNATLQFLVYNEFEQRFSTSTKVTCFKDVQLSDIDTRPGDPGDPYSIFNVGVQGTLSGQTRIRPVGINAEDGYGARTVLAVVEESWDGSTAAANIQYQGTRSQGDRIIIPLP